MSRRTPERLRQKDVKAAMDFMSPDPQGVDLTPRKLVQHERREQAALRQWVQTQLWRDYWFHIPNERQSRSEALSLAAQGVIQGLPDNWLVLPANGRPGAAQELKRVGATRSAVKPAQREWLLRLEALGWAVGCHRGWVEASEFFRDYIRGDWTPDPEDAWWR